MKLHRARDLADALRLAQDFKEAGTYDLFRGQRCRWEVKAKLCRLSLEEREEATQSLVRYLSWVRSTVGLEELAANPEAMIAVAQHHGLPTTFIDFTLDPTVAAFFASEQGTCPEGEIVCVDSSDFKEFMQNFVQVRPDLEAIRFWHLKVSNLWRLEAQRGVFLEAPIERIESLYDFDRIVFPHGGAFTSMGRNDIYPAESPLESLLHQYFSNEKNIKAHRWIAGLKLNSIRMSAPSWSDAAPFFRTVPPPVVASWSKVSRDRVLKEEAWAPHASQPVMGLAIDASSGAKAIRAAVISQMLELVQRPAVRDAIVRWEPVIEGFGDATEAGTALMRAVLARLWNGVRRLTVNDKHLAVGMATAAAMVPEYLHLNRVDGAAEEAAWGRMLDDPMRVSFGAADGSAAYGYASEKSLRSAMRRDLETLLRDEHRGAGVRLLMQMVPYPDRIFDYEALSILFAEEIAPSQVVRYSSDAVIFYSPARLDAFGLP